MVGVTVLFQTERGGESDATPLTSQPADIQHKSSVFFNVQILLRRSIHVHVQCHQSYSSPYVQQTIETMRPQCSSLVVNQNVIQTRHWWWHLDAHSVTRSTYGPRVHEFVDR